MSEREKERVSARGWLVCEHFYWFIVVILW